MEKSQNDADNNLGTALPPSLLKGIVGGAKTSSYKVLTGDEVTNIITEETKDKEVVPAAIQTVKDIKKGLADGHGMPRTATGSDSNTVLAFTPSSLANNGGFDTVKKPLTADPQESAKRYEIVQAPALTTKALSDATTNNAKAADTFKSATDAHTKATERVADKADNAKFLKEHGGSDFIVGKANASLDAAKAQQAKAADDLDKAKTASTTAEKDLAKAKTAAEDAKTKKEAQDAADKKEKADEKADKPDNKAAAFLSKHGAHVVKYGGKVLDKVAESQAKKEGTFKEHTYSNITSGDAPVVTKSEDGSTKTVTFGHVVTEGGTKSYDSSLGNGAKTTWEKRAETGTEVTKTTELGDGKSQTDVTKNYAGIGLANKAGFTANSMGITAEASSTVEGHLEYTKSKSFKDGDTTTTDTTSAVLHGVAQVKAGAHLGLDGVTVQAKASAEIIAKVESKHETDYGNVKTSTTATLYAAAKAEANAQLEAKIDLGKGIVKGKIGYGAEASAGVGAEGSTGVHSAKGNGGEVGGGVYAGKIGAKFNADVDVQDGKLSVSFEIGASLGLGATGKINIKGDLNEAKKGILDTANVIKETPALFKPFAILGAGHIALYKGLKGFFS